MKGRRMRRGWGWLAAIAVAAALAGCRGRPIEVEPYPGGRWLYVAFDARNRPVVAGVIRLTSAHPRDGQFRGEWWLGPVEGAEDAARRAGPQLGSGDVSGRLSGETLSMNLNPGDRDNNIWLNALLRDDQIDGIWEHIGFVGPLSRGTFVMRRPER